MATLASTVYVQDPDTHQTVTLAPGTNPEPRLAALVTNPSAWVDGKLPRLPKKTDHSPPGGGPDDASGDDSANASAAADDQSTDDSDQDKTEDDKPAARKAAARPARGRKAADEGTGGQ